jgi:hypothetical protein
MPDVALSAYRSASFFLRNNDDAADFVFWISLTHPAHASEYLTNHFIRALRLFQLHYM